MKTNIEQGQDQENKAPKIETKKPTAPKSEKEALETMPNTNDGKIVFNSDADFHEAVRKVVNAMGNTDVYEDDYEDSRQDLQADLMDSPRHLVTRTRWYQVRSYAIHGKEVMAPNGPITFNANWFYYQQGKHTVTYCVAEVHRQSDWDYLQRHPLFGVVFHEKQSAALSGDMAIVDKQAQSLLALSSLDPAQLERKARHHQSQGHDINMGSDSRDLMRQIAEIQGKQAHQHVQKRMKETIERSMGDQDAMEGRLGTGHLQSVGLQ